MALLTRRERLGQIKDVVIPSLTTAAPLASRRSLLRQGIPRAPDGAESCRRAWGVCLKKFEAEDLLDWLEANGRSGTLNYVRGEGFTVF